MKNKDFTLLKLMGPFISTNVIKRAKWDIHGK